MSKPQTLKSRVNGGWLVILTLPWLAFVAKTNWIFESVEAGHIDPWVYLGYFLDLSGHLRAFVAYNGGRLPWILPGYVAYKLFPPVIAAYVLHVALYYAAVFSLYLILKITFSERVALLGAVFMGFYSYFLKAMGWDYVDGAGITYFLITTLVLTYAARHRHCWLWLGVAGASYGAMIYSHLFLVAFTPSILLYYVLMNREHRRHSLLVSALFFAPGFLALTVLLGVINYELNGTFLFFLPSVQYASKLARLSNPFWRVPFRAWVSRATWIILPSIIFLNSLTFLFLFLARRLKSERRTYLQITFQVYFLLCACTLLASHIAGQPGLQLFYYASFLIPTMFLALGAQLAPLVDEFSSLHWVLLVSGLIAAFLLVYLFPTGSHFVRWVMAHQFALPGALALAGATLLLLRRAHSVDFGLVLVCFALGLVNLTQVASRVMGPTLQRDAFLAIVRSVRAIQSVDPSSQVLFWYRADEPMGKLYRAVSSTYLWGHRLINERFPSLERGDDSFHTPEPNSRLVVLSSQQDAFQKADQALNRIGFGSQVIAERTIQQGPIAWKLVFIGVQNWPLIEDIHLSANGWPQAVHLRWQSQEREVVALLGPSIHQLFKSDMNTTADWEINRYGSVGGLGIQRGCLMADDNCGLYASGDPRDHLVSPFAALSPSKAASVFFSVWTKPLSGHAIPTVMVQDEHFSSLAEGRELLRRPDGWVLVGNWSKILTPQRLRILVIQHPGAASLLAKALLVEFANHSLAQPAKSSRKHSTGS